ncbi:MAG: mannose-1-phosphate guanylyltransferase/mannose-6-phosphate isomerase [Myxococcota bacterium]
MVAPSTSASFEDLQPIVLCGGSGSRLWPLSREHYPKQLLPLLGPQSLLASTLTRLGGTGEMAARPALVITNETYRFLTAEECRQAGVPVSRILLEPVGRNTAPALTVSALYAQQEGQDPILLVMPADHAIADKAAFRTAVGQALTHARAGKLVTFGITPTAPETGYGYLEVGEELAHAPGRWLARFVEKPDRTRAEAFVASGQHLWNAGIFVFRASVWLEMLGRYQPEMLRFCREAFETGQGDQDFFRLNRGAFEQCPADSIDYAVMERVTGDHTLLAQEGEGRAVVIPFSGGWSDVGAWDALWTLSEKDGAGNRVRGDALVLDSQNTYVEATHRLVACLGVQELVVVETPDAVLVAHRGAAQEVKKIVAQLKAAGRSELLSHRKEHRPWGWYDALDGGERFQVKRIVVRPGASLSLQMHHHRAEHWVVVRGTARVTRGEESFLVGENQSTYIPLGTRHRLENPGKIDLEMIEVQSGSYLGEDDIVRFEDAYRRV